MLIYSDYAYTQLYASDIRYIVTDQVIKNLLGQEAITLTLNGKFKSLLATFSKYIKMLDPNLKSQTYRDSLLKIRINPDGILTHQLWH